MSEIIQNSSQPGPTGGLVVTQELIEEFLASLIAKGRTAETVATYRSYLKRVYAFLPASQEITKGTLRELWAKMEADHYATSTINVSISAANSLLEYCDRRDLQLPLRAKNDNAAQPELTRGDYQRMLQTARRNNKETAYLMVKLFATTGINVQELEQITVEALQGGEKGEKTEVVLPDFLREELENYAERQDVAFGPIFINRSGNPLSRSTVAQLIGDLAAEADVAREKCNPRCLQKLCYETKRLVERNLYTQMQKMYEGILAEEQRDVGWV